MSRLLALQDFLLDTGVLEDPVFGEDDEKEIAELERLGVLERSDEWIESILKPRERPVLDWVREPVGVREFLNDPYYLGEAAGSLFKRLETDFVDVFEDNAHEVILAGSIGWGKTYFMALGMVRQLYEISCLADPQRYFGIAPKTPVVMINLSVTGAQAKNACFAYVKTVVDGSPYFQEHFQRDTNLDASLIFPGHVRYSPGSSSEFSAIGTNVIAGAVDEANFLVSAKKMAHEKAQNQDVDHARVLYRALARRIESRFKFSKGWKGRLFLASSRVYDGDFIDQQVRSKAGRPGVKVLDYSHWDVREFRKGQPTVNEKTGDTMYSGDVFRVVIGGTGESSRILTPDEILDSEANVIEVPVEYRETFETDIEGAIRDVAGKATFALNPWIPDRKAISERIVDSVGGAPLVHPFPDDTLRGLTADSRVAEHLNLGVLCARHVVREGYGSGLTESVLYKPLRAPDRPRYAHIDLAINRDAAGLAVGYVSGYTQARIKNPGDVETVVREVPIITFEILARFVAPKGYEIEFEGMRDILYKLRDGGGFSFASVTFDQFQSRDSQQILKARGFAAEEISVDRDLAPYSVLRNGILGGWIQYYRHETALRELRKLQRALTPGKRVKVDHPKFDGESPDGRGSKDVTDAMAAVVSKIMEMETEAGIGAAPMVLQREAPMPIEGSEWLSPDNNWIASDFIREGIERELRKRKAQK